MKNKSGVKYLFDRFIKNDPEMTVLFEQAKVGEKIADEIHRMKKNKKLSNYNIAKITELDISVVAKLEECDYNEYSKKMLDKVLKKLELNEEIRAIEGCAKQNNLDAMTETLKGKIK